MTMYPTTRRDVTLGRPSVSTEPKSSARTDTDARQREASLAIAAVWDRSRDAVMARLAVLELASLAFQHGVFDHDDRRHTTREAHKLVGSLGTFGFAEGSRLAR